MVQRFDAPIIAKNKPFGQDIDGLSYLWGKS